MRLVVVAVLLLAAACRPPGWGKGDDEPATDAAPGADAAPDSATDGPALTCERTFRLEEHASATSVWVTGDFIAWGGDPSAGALEMMLGADTVWTAARTFEAGSYQYKFIVDGASWIADPANPDFIDDGFGGRNSVYVCAP